MPFATMRASILSFPSALVSRTFARSSRRLPLLFPHLNSGRLPDPRRPSVQTRICEEHAAAKVGNIGRRRFSNLAGVFGVFATIAVLPAYAQYPATTLNIGSAPGAVVVNPVTNTIYVARENLVGATWNTITAIDGATSATSAIMAGQDPY